MISTTASEQAHDAAMPPTAVKGNLRKWLRTRWPAPANGSDARAPASPAQNTHHNTISGLLFGQRKSITTTRRNSKTLTSGTASTGMHSFHAILPTLFIPPHSFAANPATTSLHTHPSNNNSTTYKNPRSSFALS